MKVPIIFVLSLYAVFVGQAISSDNHGVRSKSLRNFSELVSSLREKIGAAIKDTVNEEKESIANALDSLKTAAEDTATASKNVAKASLDIALMVPRVGWNILSASADNSSIGHAINVPLEKSKESIVQAIDSIKGAASRTYWAGIVTVQTGWDLGTILPKFGGHLFNETRRKLQDALIKTYQDELQSISQAILSVKEAGQKISQVGRDVKSATWELSTIIPTLSIEIFTKNKQVGDEIVNKKLQAVDMSVRNAVNLVREAGDKISTAGVNVAKASVDLSLMMAKYGLNLLTKDDKENIHQAVQKQVHAVRQSVENAVSAVQEAMDKITDATTDAAKAGLDVGIAVPKLSYDLYEQEKDNIDMAVQNTFENVKSSVSRAFGKIKEAGAKISEAGSGVVKAGWTLGLAVPKFGISLLTQQKDIFNSTILKPFQEDQESMTDTTKLLANAGGTFVEAGNTLSKSPANFRSRELGVIPEIPHKNS